MRRVSVLAGAFLLPLLFVLPPNLQAGSADQRLDVYWIDSEGGGSTLIVTPAGAMLASDELEVVVVTSSS